MIVGKTATWKEFSILHGKIVSFKQYGKISAINGKEIVIKTQNGNTIKKDIDQIISIKGELLEKNKNKK